MDKYFYSPETDLLIIGIGIITITTILMIYGQIKRHYTKRKPKWLDKM